MPTKKTNKKPAAKKAAAKKAAAKKAAAKKPVAKKAPAKKAAAKGRYKSKDFKQTLVTLEAHEMATICNALEAYKENRLLAAFLAQRK